MDFASLGGGGGGGGTSAQSRAESSIANVSTLGLTGEHVLWIVGIVAASLVLAVALFAVLKGKL